MTDFSGRHHRGLWGLIVVAVILGGVVLYLALAGGDSDQTSTAAAGPTGGDDTTLAGSQLMVRAVDQDDPDGNGRVFVLKGGRPRELEQELDCERVYYAGGRGLCLVTAEGGDNEHAIIFDSSLRSQKRLPFSGLPSRTRVSRDGRYGAMTVFVNGHGYEGAGGFTTATTLVDMRTESALGNLDNFEVTKNGKPFDPDEVNFWGVTFAGDSDRFYATLQTGDHHYLVQGSVAQRTMKILRDGVECPSLSPDGTRIAYKSLVGEGEDLRLRVLDLNTLEAHAVAERRPIDDQVEWLNDETLVYSNDLDVFTVPANGGGAPRLILHDASSPVTLELNRSPSSKPPPESEPQGEG